MSDTWETDLGMHISIYIYILNMYLWLIESTFLEVSLFSVLWTETSQIVYI